MTVHSDRPQCGPDELRREWLRELTREQYGSTVPEWSAAKCGRRADPTAWEQGLLRRAELERAINRLPDDYEQRPELPSRRRRP
jgi:hypothetical protein